MQFEVSYASYGILQESDKQRGFQIYFVSGFVDEFDLSTKFKLFQTPSEIELLEDETVYSLFLVKDIIFLNSQWYTGRSKGNRNCYDGFSMAIKYYDSLPDFISLSLLFLDQLKRYKNTNDIRTSGLQQTLTFDKSNKRNVNITERIKRRLLELHCNDINIQEIIFNVLCSIFTRNKSNRYIYFTQDKTLFNRVLSISVVKMNFCDSIKDSTHKVISTLNNQTEYKLKYKVKQKFDLNVEELNKIEAQIELEKNILIELKSNIDIKRRQYYLEVQKRKEEISYLEKRIIKLRKMILKLIRLNKKAPLFLGLILMVIAAIITLAITLYIVYGG